MELYAKVIGEGKPLLILHGLFGMGDNWKTLANRFYKEKGLQVHLIDLRNHGRSPHTDEFSYELMAEDVKEYCEKYQLNDLVLLGHSMGGKVAMDFAANYPELLQALIVVDIAPKSYPPHHEVIMDGLQVLYDSELSSRKEADEKLKEFIEDWGVRQFLLKNLYRKERDQLVLRMNFPVLKAKYSEVTASISEDARYDGASFFIKGEKSGYIKDEDRGLIRRHFPKSQMITIKDAGHWVHAEKAEAFFEAVSGFLKYNQIIS